MRQTPQSLATLGLMLIAMGLVLAFIWWLVVYSPIGLGKAFDVLIDGPEMRRTFNGVFVVVLTVDAIAAIVCFFLAAVKVLQDWVHRLTGKASMPAATGAVSVERLIKEASIETETAPSERVD